MAFGFGWTPCIGPILGSILALASTEETIYKSNYTFEFLFPGLSYTIHFVGLFNAKIFNIF